MITSGDAPIAMFPDPHRLGDTPPSRPSPFPAVVGSGAVPDKELTPAERIALEMKKESVRSSLYTYALWRTRSEWEANDLVGDAVLEASDPARKPWDPAKRSFFKHMRYLMDDIAIERARSGYKRFEEVGSEIAFEEVLVDPRPLADDVLDAYRTSHRLQRWGGHLGDVLQETDPMAAKVLEASSLGLETLAEHAAHAGCTEDEAFEATRRLKYQGAKIVQEEAKAEAQRMKEARARAKKKGGA